MWYCAARHSVGVKIMCSFPKKVLLVKAKMLQQEYYASCLRNRLEPETVEISGPWLASFLTEYRISSRKTESDIQSPASGASRKASDLLARNSPDP